MASARPPHVLVVEDDDLVRSFLRLALQRGGMSIAEAHDAAGALRRLRAESFDALLVDGLLPDMHGVSLAGVLLDDPRTACLPVCFLSGAVRARRRIDAGFGCLAKPVRPDTLVQQLHTLLEWRDNGGSTTEERRAALRNLENGFLVGP